MKAVVFQGPYKVLVQDRATPRLQEETDVVVRTMYTALCGSDLHIYRGLESASVGTVMGHEFTGVIEYVGSRVKDFQVRDRVVSPFTVSCGTCFFCARRCSSRCVEAKVYGSPGLDGAQAEYVRVPYADSTLKKAPEGIEPRNLVLMGDIFPTGYFAVQNAIDATRDENAEEMTVIVLGCGPVGLCAIVNVASLKPKHLLAVDAVSSRLDLAQSLGAEPWNFQSNREGLMRRVQELTDERGADVVIEVVGLSPALRLAFDLLRPFGFLSSVGVHNGEIPWTAEEGYSKNVRLQMGRCPVRSIFEPALEAFEAKQDKLSFLSNCVMPLSQAERAYDLFDKKEVEKVIFDPTQ